MFTSLFKYESLGWVEEEIQFPDYETALCFAEVERELLDGFAGIMERQLYRIVEFRIVETSNPFCH